LPHAGELQAFELAAAIEQAVEDSAALASKTSVFVIAEYPAHLPPVAGDQSQLSRLIADLITDSLGGLERGEIKVRAELFSSGQAPAETGMARDLAEGGPWALVTLTGRASTAGTSSVQDAPAKTAVSLAPGSDRARAAAELGGHLWSEPAQEGTRIHRLAVPLREVHVARPDVSSLQRAVKTHLPADGEPGKTLLLAVEGAAVHSLLTQELQAQGYQVVSPGGSESLLTMAQRDRPDLILIDLLFRDSTAFDLALLLKQDARTRAIPVLFLTSFEDPESGLRMDAAKFVVRPKGTGALLAAVQSVLHSGVGPSARVLVVEPDPRARDSLIRMIQLQGYRVSEAETVEEAMALAERASPGLALVNAQLAQERDFWLLRQLRLLSPSIEILVLAEAGNEEDAKAVLQRGASGYGETGELTDLLRKVGRGPTANGSEGRTGR
jgi:DNA-binding response OmpR family regulator